MNVRLNAFQIIDCGPTYTLIGTDDNAVVFCGTRFCVSSWFIVVYVQHNSSDNYFHSNNNRLNFTDGQQCGHSHDFDVHLGGNCSTESHTWPVCFGRTNRQRSAIGFELPPGGRSQPDDNRRHVFESQQLSRMICVDHVLYFYFYLKLYHTFTA